MPEQTLFSKNSRPAPALDDLMAVLHVIGPSLARGETRCNPEEVLRQAKEAQQERLSEMAQELHALTWLEFLRWTRDLPNVKAQQGARHVAGAEWLRRTHGLKLGDGLVCLPFREVVLFHRVDSVELVWQDGAALEEFCVRFVGQADSRDGKTRTERTVATSPAAVWHLNKAAA